MTTTGKRLMVEAEKRRPGSFIIERPLKGSLESRIRDLEARNSILERSLREVRSAKDLIKTENRQLEKRLKKSKERDKAKSRFFADVFREFRVPLESMERLMGQLLANNPDKDQEEKARAILGNSRGLLDVVDQMLELAKLDIGEIELHAAPQEIVPFIKSIVMSFESLALEKNVKLNFQVKVADIWLYFEPEKLKRIIAILVSNAIAYTPRGGKIAASIRTAPDNESPSGFVEISVRDTRLEIPSDRGGHFFDLYYRGERGLEHHPRGAGAGLALARRLVELHHGEIEARCACVSDHVEGMEFIIRLPRGKGHLSPEEIVDCPHFNSGGIPSRYVSARQNIGRLNRIDGEKRGTMYIENEVSVSSRDAEFIKKVCAEIKENLSDPEFNVELLIQKFSMTPTTFRRKLKALTGKSANRMIRSYRLARAALLLESNFGNISDVAYAVGFSSSSYFSKCFKEKFRHGPKAYVSKIRPVDNSVSPVDSSPSNNSTSLDSCNPLK